MRVGSAEGLVTTCSGLAAGRKKIKLTGLALDHKVTGDRFYTHVVNVGQRLSQRAPSMEEDDISSQDTRGKPRESEYLARVAALGTGEGGSSHAVSTHTEGFSLPLQFSQHHMI